MNPDLTTCAVRTRMFLIQRELLGSPRLEEVSTWNIFSEDASLRDSEAPKERLIGQLETSLLTAIKRAVMLEPFYTWGYGGRVERATLPGMAIQ
jgi:hypothetical protein